MIERKSLFCWLGLLLGTSLLSGCSEPDEIRKYTVKRIESTVASASHPKLPPENPTDRMLAAMVMHGEKAWFFKVAGPDTAVASVLEPFVAFVKSVRFEKESDSPMWTAPNDWERLPGSEFRFATLKIPAAVPLELTVIPLPFRSDSIDDYTLQNVNRWRDQLQLPPLAKKDLADQTSQLELADGKQAIYVNYLGSLGGGPAMGRPPFMNGGASEKTVGASPSVTPPSPPTANSPGFTFEEQTGWEKSAGNQFSAAAFKVRDGEQVIDITVSAAGGDLVANVNRWRGQVGLAPLPADELVKSLKELDVDGTKGAYAVLVGPDDAARRETLLGVVIPRSNATWFVKLRGDADLAERERERFEAFVKSLKFEKN